MVTIRLQRWGKRNNPFYKIVLIDKSQKRNGNYITSLGSWHPQKNLKTIDKKAITQWMQKGAKLSKAVEDLMS